ncbi:MAG: hypothetical protein GF313_15075 [Caldithrix sp.]|nr:hypothetical protein [Caldithrix sp.]
MKLKPLTFYPVGDNNEHVYKFMEHNDSIQQQLVNAEAQPGNLVAGIKKDVVISNKITDLSRPGHVVIYGWHRLNGQAIQPLANIYLDTYVYYSHGIRIIYETLLVDG